MQHELIRRKVLIEGMSRRAVAKELHHSRKTVRKALARIIHVTGRTTSRVQD